MKNEQGQAFKELLIILNHMQPQYKEKIPKELIDFFEKNSQKDYTFDLDLKVPLKEQKLKSKTLSLLAMLDLNYWCETSEEKQGLIDRYLENERKYQEKLREKYNPENIFKRNNRQQSITKESFENEIEIVEYKESKIEIIIRKIKNIIKKFV